MTLFEKTLKEAKIQDAKLDDLKNTEFDDSALEYINKAIDKALQMNGSQAIISEIMKYMEPKFDGNQLIEAGFENFLSNYSVKELEPLKDYLSSDSENLHSIIEDGQKNKIWHLSQHVNEALFNIFSEMYDITQNTGGRTNKGKGEYLLSILLGKNCKFTTDFDLAFGNEKIEVKAYGGRLDGNYSKAASISPSNCRDILKEILGNRWQNLKNLYQSGKMPTGKGHLFIGSSNNLAKKYKTILNTPMTQNAGVDFNISLKSTSILGLGKMNIMNQWKELKDALLKMSLSDSEIKEIFTTYLRKLYLERYSEYKLNAVRTLIDGICGDLANAIYDEQVNEALALVAELELCLFVETATSNKIDRKLQNLILIGKTSTNDVYILLIGFANSDPLSKNLGDNVRNGNVKTTKFDSSNQASNLGLKLAGTRK